MPSPVRGVMVTDVTPAGPSDEKLFRNDVITEVLERVRTESVGT
jgi:S1-C subfamily serine protease